MEEKNPKQTLHTALRHPLQWLRGKDLPYGVISPGELFLYFWGYGFNLMSAGFTNRQTLVFTESFRIDPARLTVPGIISSIWDGLNDPFIGTWMDARHLKAATLRWIMRLATVTGSLFAVFKIWDGGFTAFQHIVVLVLCNCLQDVFGTFSGVAGTKFMAGVSPFTEERGRIANWQGVAYTIFYLVYNTLPQLLYASQRFSVYTVSFYGALIALPFALLGGFLPTFARQRVDFNAVSEAKKQEGEEEKINLKESFSVLKHNQLFLVSAVASLITVFTPTTGDQTVMWSALGPRRQIGGLLAKLLGTTEANGIHFLTLKQLLHGVAPMLLKPWNRIIVQRLGGPLRTLRTLYPIGVLCKIAETFTGITTLPRIFALCAIENLSNVCSDVWGLATSMINFEYYDKVELETGLRSEGLTSAVNALLAKFVTNNIGTATGNAYVSWTGYRGGIIDQQSEVPERYAKTIWPMLCLTEAFDRLVWFVAYLFLHWSPEDRTRTEIELEDRRRAAQEKLESIHEEEELS
ncbi:MAG: MFS transporter [Oscillospiraceae bacterium]|jgi:Na+/melibiose symporter-like transporter|nr:MFS transporter [Oscillospiraceae bacterium]